MTSQVHFSGNKSSILLKILDKHGITGLSVQDRGLSPNNLSRSKFIKFCKRNGFNRIGMSNSFEIAGKVYGYSLASGGVECRQFGEHYDGLVCEFKDGSFGWYDKSQLRIGGITRIGPDGTKYFNVVGEKK